MSTPEMGIHGYIEFGNRLLTFILVAIALASVLSVVRRRHTQPLTFRLALAIALGIFAQAVIGGITVLLELHPLLVGIHFIVSAALAACATALLFHLRRAPGARHRPTATSLTSVALLATTTVLTVTLGTLTTGAGPHAGDDATARNGLHPEAIQHIHAVACYLLAACSVWVTYQAARTNDRQRKQAAAALLAVIALQIVVGVAQARLGLPIILVGIHMVLACVLVAACTWLSLTLLHGHPSDEDRAIDPLPSGSRLTSPRRTETPLTRAKDAMWT